MTVASLDDVLYIKEIGYQENDPSLNLIPIVLDATTTYSKRYSATATENPVGDKTTRADHYWVKPPSLSFSGVISNTDIGLYEWSNYTRGSKPRTQQYIERLEAILKNRRLVELRIPDGLTTTNCLITSLDIKKAKANDSYEISISARQISFVKEAILAVPTPELKDTLEDHKDKGTNTSTELSIGQATGGQVGLEGTEEGLEYEPFTGDDMGV